MGTLSPHSEAKGYSVMERLSYSHIELLVEIEDETKRLFYEVECIRGNWSVRGLKRQEAMSESHLEEQLIGKLEDFLLELGNGFCFEARQKRILITEFLSF
jgi:predicted nuclease of restriction endonuclease-like (RecB) superfamily